MLNSENSELIYYADRSVDYFSNLILEDSIYYAVGRNFNNYYLYKFNENLDIIHRVRITGYLFQRDFIAHKNNFIIVGSTHKEISLFQINKKLQIKNSTVLNGVFKSSFCDSNSIYILCMIDQSLMIFQFDSNLNQINQKKISNILQKDYYGEWKIYSRKGKKFLLNRASESIILYEFFGDWELENTIVLKEEKNRNQIGFHSDSIFLYDNKNNLYTYNLKGKLIQTNEFNNEKETNSTWEPESNLIVLSSKYQDKIELLNTSEDRIASIQADFAFRNFGIEKVSNNSYLLYGSSKYNYKWATSSFGLIVKISRQNNNISLFHDNNYVDQLEIAYQQQDSTLIWKIVNDWYLKNSTNSLPQNYEKYEQETYKLFEQIYSETSNFMNELMYNKKKNMPEFHLLKNSIHIEIVDSIRTIPDNEVLHKYKFYEPGTKIIISNFLPELGLKNKVIHSDQDIQDALLLFLSKSNNDSKDLYKRLEFLSPYLDIVNHHWGDAPHIFSQPNFYDIILDKNYKKAIISYRNRYSFKKILCEKVDDKWKRKKVLYNAIE
ncbi:MAG: hypothetical protein K8S23_01910 [Candidatus Cloacimonetes bacterium]|nr:hypothetical protein [Candidatus Cloacimonadota bacterium]